MKSYTETPYSPRKEINENNLNFLNEEVSNLEEEFREVSNDYRPSHQRSFNDRKYKIIKL